MVVTETYMFLLVTLQDTERQQQYLGVVKMAWNVENAFGTWRVWRCEGRKQAFTVSEKGRAVSNRTRDLCIIAIFGRVDVSFGQVDSLSQNCSRKPYYGGPMGSFKTLKRGSFERFNG